jgi:TonB family protein
MNALLVVTLLLAAQVARQPYTPPRLASGSPPGIAQPALGGGQALVELSIDPRGAVTKVTPLRTTPPFSAMLLDAVSAWRFTPALDDPLDINGRPQGSRAVASKVLVAALYRPPTLITPTQGQAPVNVAAASPDVPYPSSIIEPPYPPQSMFPGVVMIEARLNASGAVTVARVLSSAPGFDDAALQAARHWRFSPPRVDSRYAEAYVYLIFGFPQPITGNY